MAKKSPTNSGEAFWAHIDTVESLGQDNLPAELLLKKKDEDDDEEEINIPATAVPVPDPEFSPVTSNSNSVETPEQNSTVE